MRHSRQCSVAVALLTVLSVSGCGGLGRLGLRSAAPATEAPIAQDKPLTAADTLLRNEESGLLSKNRRVGLRSLFSGATDPNITLEVNKYLWKASLEVLDFLPIESIDPFSGVIVTGYGTPPGGGRAYRATILVQDPALDARSLKIAMQSRGGAAISPDTIRAVEDAIMTRARQLRIQDGKL